ncbi:hypothetical protein [Xanthomonas sp. LF06-19]|uniref:hypothetical protein n=1 Tax=Xanthomonas sp. LF06-19 TaxID=3097551 RepID=UPI0025F23229|nr:hypothetical protein [Xanthomonas sp. LF06-19]MDY4284702.1 hypothetical protein [Xanthomonas sp. LF06-19]
MRHDDRHSAASPPASAPPPQRARDASGTPEVSAWWKQLCASRWLRMVVSLLVIALAVAVLLRGYGHG